MSVRLEDQYLIVGGILTNELAASSSIGELKSGYFEDPACSIIYQSFYNYYKKYKKLPSELELDSLIKENYIPIGPSVEDVEKVCHKLVTLGPKVDEDYLLKNIETFIKNTRVNNELTKVLEMYTNTKTIDSNDFAKKLSDSLDFSLIKSGISSMSDVNSVLESRSEVIGTNDSTLIKSVFPFVNSSLLYQGYVKGTLNVVVAPPGCFTGDTKVLTLDGKQHSIESLYKSNQHLSIYGMNPEKMEVTPAPADKVVLSKYTDELVEVLIDRRKVIKCTPDHPFMIEDGTYVEAQNLKPSQILRTIKRGYGRYGKHGISETVSTLDEKAHFTRDLVLPFVKGYKDSSQKLIYKDHDESNNSINNLECEAGFNPEHMKKVIDIVNHHRVTKVTRIHLDKPVPVYGIMNAGFYNNYAISLDQSDDSIGSEGVIVSNTGKTNLLVNEGAYAARQGANVLHIFLGDMLKYDGFIRYASNIIGEDQNTLIKMTPEQVKSLIQTYSSKDHDNIFGKISYEAFASAEVTSHQLISYITNAEKVKGINYDVIIIDYADNFAMDQDNSYSELGDVYDSLLWLARMNHSVVLTASQPKVGYWDQEIIPMEGLGDSSKKQRIVDMIMSFNKPSRGSSIGTLYLSKVRRGTTGSLARVKLDNKLCRIRQITEEEYTQVKEQEGAGDD